MALCLCSVQAPAGGDQKGEADADTIQAKLQPEPVEHHEELHRQRALQDPHAGEGLAHRGCCPGAPQARGGCWDSHAPPHPMAACGVTGVIRTITD